MRSRLYLTRPSGANGDDQDPASRDVRELQRKKANYAGVGDSLVLHWKDGVFVRDDVPGGVFAAIRRDQAEQAFLACLDEMRSQGRNVTDAANSPRYAPKMFGKMKQAAGLSARDLDGAMTRLFASHKIMIGTVPGNDRHPIKAIVRTESGVAGSAGSPLVSP